MHFFKTNNSFHIVLQLRNRTTTNMCLVGIQLRLQHDYLFSFKCLRKRLRKTNMKLNSHEKDFDFNWPPPGLTWLLLRKFVLVEVEIFTLG